MWYIHRCNFTYSYSECVCELFDWHPPTLLLAFLHYGANYNFIVLISSRNPVTLCTFQHSSAHLQSEQRLISQNNWKHLWGFAEPLIKPLNENEQSASLTQKLIKNNKNWKQSFVIEPSRVPTQLLAANIPTANIQALTHPFFSYHLYFCEVKGNLAESNQKGKCEIVC